MELYLKDGNDPDDESECERKITYEKVNERWEVAVTLSHKGFQQASFVNSIATTKVELKCRMLKKRLSCWRMKTTTDATSPVH
jgi:DNA topoisomerase-2